MQLFLPGLDGITIYKIAENWSRMTGFFFTHGWDQRSAKFTDGSKIGWIFVIVVIKKSQRYNSSHYAEGICKRRFQRKNVFRPQFPSTLRHRNLVPRVSQLTAPASSRRQSDKRRWERGCNHRSFREITWLPSRHSSRKAPFSKCFF